MPDAHVAGGWRVRNGGLSAGDFEIGSEPRRRNAGESLADLLLFFIGRVADIEVVDADLRLSGRSLGWLFLGESGSGEQNYHEQMAERCCAPTGEGARPHTYVRCRTAGRAHVLRFKGGLHGRILLKLLILSGRNGVCDYNFGMANLVLIYGMRLLPAEEIEQIGDALIKLKNGREAHVTMHVLEGSKEAIEKQLRTSVESFFDMYPEI